MHRSVASLCRETSSGGAKHAMEIRGRQADVVLPCQLIGFGVLSCAHESSTELGDGEVVSEGTRLHRSVASRVRGNLDGRRQAGHISARCGSLMRRA